MPSNSVSNDGTISLSNPPSPRTRPRTSVESITNPRARLSPSTEELPRESPPIPAEYVVNENLPEVLAPPEDDVEPQEPPPPYNANLQVTPMTAEQTTRYDRGPLPVKSLPKHFQIPMALYTLTPPPGQQPVPQGWLEFVHPEGQKYYYHPNRRIITDSNIKSPAVLQVLYRALSILDLRLNAQNLILPQTTEVTFEVDIEQQPPVVRYYYVDHAQKTEFWLEKSSTEALKCPPVTSYTHLRHLFRQHYWTHIEFYPMHLTLSVDVEDELVAVLTHACIDYMTSTLSTVPYNQEQCEAYLRLIRNMPESERAEGYRNCVLARLWSEIDGNFFVNLRGEDIPRLSRTQRLLPEPNIRKTGLINFLKKSLMLGASEAYERTLNEMWVDKISYASHWRKFMINMVGEWKMHAVWTFVIMIVASMTFALSMSNKVISESWTAIFLQSSGLISLIVSLIGLGSSFVLVKMHRHQTEASASEAGDYLDNYFHKSLGLQPLSIIYALPQAASVWSFALLSTSILIYTLNLDSIVARIVVGVLMTFVVTALWFLSVCLSGKDDGTGSIVRDSVRRAREEVIPQSIDQVQRVTTELGRRVLGRSEGQNPRRQSPENVAEAATIVSGRNSGESGSERRSEGIVNVSGRNGGRENGYRSNLERSDVTVNARQASYSPRADTPGQIFSRTASSVASTAMSSINSWIRLARPGHGYQRVETTETPLERQFRNINASRRGSADITRISRGSSESARAASINAQGSLSGSPPDRISAYLQANSGFGGRGP